MQSITLKHISELSGYSISTVSKALNNGNDVSKQTRLKIRELAKSNNYIPNSTALALRSKKTKIIAVIVPHINSTFYSNVLSGIQANAFNKGYKVLILQSFASKKRELDCINNVRDGSVDGVIIIMNNENNYSFNLRSNLSKSNTLPIISHPLKKV